MARKILILFVLFIACYMSAHYYIRWKNTKTDDVTKISRLVECEPNELKSLEIRQQFEGAANVLQFERTDQPEAGMPSVLAVEQWSWRTMKPVVGEADAGRIRRIAFAICELYDPIRLKNEDFKPADATRRRGETLLATLEKNGKKRELSFHIGAATADHMITIEFSEDKSSPRVLKISDQFLQALSLEPAAYQNLRVMRTEADNVQQVTLLVDGKERFSLERAGADWKVLQAGKEKGNGSEEATRFVNRFSTLQGLSVDDANLSPKDCIAGKAKAILNLKAVAGKEEILHFDFGKTGDVSACSSGRTSKFRVHRDFVKFIDVPLKAVLAK